MHNDVLARLVEEILTSTRAPAPRIDVGEILRGIKTSWPANGANERTVQIAEIEALVAHEMVRVRRIALMDEVGRARFETEFASWKRWDGEGGVVHRQLTCLTELFLRGIRWNTPIRDPFPGIKFDVYVEGIVAECGDITGDGGISRIFECLRNRIAILLVPYTKNAPRNAVGWLFQPYRWVARDVPETPIVLDVCRTCVRLGRVRERINYTPPLSAEARECIENAISHGQSAIPTRDLIPWRERMAWEPARQTTKKRTRRPRSSEKMP